MEMFRKAFNLPANDPQVVITDVDPGILGGDESAEVSLDSEWSGAVAPGATIKVVISSTTLTTNGVFLSASYIVDNNVADIMMVSFEACELKLTPEQNAFLNATWQQAAAEGISVFVASGDQGPADCDVKGLSASPASRGLAVNGLALTPFNTAVGGPNSMRMETRPHIGVPRMFSARLF
jgi:subtilase family serine protease